MTTADDARNHFRENHHAVLITRRRDGGVQASPVAAAVGGGGHIVVSSRETAMKVKNLRRDPRASLVGINDGWYGSWVQVEGSTEIVGLPDALEPLVDYYRSIAGEHPDWDEYREAMRAERRVLIRVTIERAGPNVSG